MAKVRTTLTIDEDVLRWVKVRAARTGKGDSQVIEESLRRDLGLDLLDQLWERNQLGEAEAIDLAVEAQHATRRRRR
jgi:ribbon-helix-helix CopG family protein